jgi:phosphoglucomutase
MDCCNGNGGVKRMPYESARKATTTTHDFMMPYVKDLASVIDMDCIRSAGIRMSADPLGGATVHYWESIRALWCRFEGRESQDRPRFSFMTVDHDRENPDGLLQPVCDGGAGD